MEENYPIRCYCVDDFNLDFLKHDEHPPTEKSLYSKDDLFTRYSDNLIKMYVCTHKYLCETCMCVFKHMQSSSILHWCFLHS